MDCARGYCKYTDTVTGNVSCLALSNDTNLHRFGTINSTQTCIDKSTTTSSFIAECAFGYCISSNVAGTLRSCEAISSSANRFGRNNVTHECLTSAGQAVAVLQYSLFPSFYLGVDICAPGHCIFTETNYSNNGIQQQSCQALSTVDLLKAGKESITQRCLQLGELTTANGLTIDECAAPGLCKYLADPVN